MMFHKTSVVGEADYRLQSRGEMQMALQSVKPQVPRIVLRGHKGGWYLLGIDIDCKDVENAGLTGVRLPRLPSLLPSKHINQATGLSDSLRFHFCRMLHHLAARFSASLPPSTPKC